MPTMITPSFWKCYLQSVSIPLQPCNALQLITACETKVDVCLIIDSSGSIRDNNPADRSYDNWQLLLDFLSTLVGAFTIGK